MMIFLVFRLFEWLVQFINNQIKSNSFQNVIGKTFHFLHLSVDQFVNEDGEILLDNIT